MTFKCTGAKCPLKFGAVLRCTFKCEYRTPPMTNADKIRAMTDEELAMFLQKKLSPPVFCCPPHSICSSARCIECWLNWLKAEAEEDS